MNKNQNKIFMSVSNSMILQSKFRIEKEGEIALKELIIHVLKIIQ
jgi:hypothetical protein